MENARNCVPRCGRVRDWANFALVLAMVLASSIAWAEPDPDACISTHADAQVLAKAGKLLEARKKFESCSTESCPKVIQKDCKNLGKAVEKAIPTLRVSLMEHNGAVLKDFRVELDGVALSKEASSQPIAVDPGEHRFRLLAADHSASDLTVPVREGEKDRSVVVQYAPVDPAATKARIAGYALGGVGAFAFISFVAFGVSGYLDEHKLEKAAPRIGNHDDLSTVDSMRRNYLVADVSLGVSLVSLGVATYLLYITKDSARRPRRSPPVAFDLRGFGDGAAAFVGGVF